MIPEVEVSTPPDENPEVFRGDVINARIQKSTSIGKKIKKSSRKSPHVVREEHVEILEVDTVNLHEHFEVLSAGMVNVNDPPRTKEDMIRYGLMAENASGMACMICGYESGWRGFTRIQRHMEQKHSIGPGYPCPLCLYVAKTKDDCQKHGKLMHRAIFSYRRAARNKPFENKPQKVRKLN